MKKIVALFMILICSVIMPCTLGAVSNTASIPQYSNSNIMWYRSTAFAMAQVNTYTGAYTWGDWQQSNVNICIDNNKDMVYIYSATPQTYRIVSNYTKSSDNGGESVSFKVIDQDNDRATMRLRICNDGTLQFYIDFNNVAWVYNVVRSE